MRIYISGPMKGYPNSNYDAFYNAKKLLESVGYEVISPADIGKRLGNVSYERFLREDIRELVECQAIYMLKGWEQSYGAGVEHLIARALKMKIVYQYSHFVD